MASASPNLPQTMRAWRFTTAAGGLEKNLQLDTNTPLPPEARSLGKDQVLVKVSAAALNPVDYKLAEFAIASRLLITKPASPGSDFAGTVVALGSEDTSTSTDLKPGQGVFGTLGAPVKQFGTLGEYIVARRSGIAPLPDGVSAEDASGLGIAALTAYQSVVVNAKEGDSIFINGGSGGTGTFGIQLAKAKKCFVATTCSTGNVQLLKDLGADLVIDYKTSDVVAELVKSGRRYDLVVDNIGIPAAVFWQGKEYAKPGAKFAQVGMPTSEIHLAFARVSWPSFLGGPGLQYSLVVQKPAPEQLRQLAEWVKDGTVKVVKDSTFSYEEAPKAYEPLKTGRARGKVVVRVRQ